MNQYVVTALAEEGVFAIWSYIATDNMEAADRVEPEIYSAYWFLATQSLAGHFRSDLTNRPVRFWHPKSKKVAVESGQNRCSAWAQIAGSNL